MCIRIPVAPGASSYSVAPSRASSGRQKIRCRVHRETSDTSTDPVLAWLYVVDAWEGGIPSARYLGVMAEAAPTRQLWAAPLHPYTEALIGAVPHPDGSGFLPEALPGEVPDPGRPPTGCRFHPRCPYAFDRCPEEEPPLVALADGRLAACWLQPAGAAPAQPGTRAAALAIEPRVE